ncbi:F0F1 ATP synthase subunit B [Kushneria phosphatilytica]|uniref:ATP synthase subunit b n=1 Tax=Kushneria phosphatilytica TaxID=657387 RepID=A0A1S1NTF7_9GAMM|nr:F0F1 ATP synthase subunit B [Kushneria phosphatilytica]OHV08885.1 F0F1 ATP synthase subunit B [Kushneria phosphatilytica]QEL12607.1 F0F1 ATP synthase subunit B [Kushneria phosphatilytica]
MNLNLTLIGQSIAFLVFVWFCMKYVWPPITKALEERRNKIEEDLASADRARQEMERVNEESERILRESREEASRILEQTRSRADRMIEEARDDAKTEGQRMIDQAKSEIDMEIQRAREDLRQQVAALAVTGAERILETEIDENRHREMLDKLAAEL